jgi:HD-like signal output (HDOD) protein
VLELVSEDEPDLTRLVKEINSDATLSAQVLRLANSPLFAFSGTISSVQHAVVTLGSQQIQSLVMSVATANYSKAAFRSESLRKCWRHTVASAVVCREIARAAGMAPEEAYSLGLLHDIGRLGLLVDYTRILEESSRDGSSLLDLERELFNMDHCEVGRLLAGQWKLPPQFLAVAGHHHDPQPESAELTHLRIAHIGCRMADTLGYWAAKPVAPAEPEELLALLPDAVRERFPGDPQALRTLIERSVSGGEAFSQPAQEFTRSDKKPVDPQAEAPVPGGLSEGQPGHALAWDFMLVMSSVLTFLFIMAALIYFGYPH